MTGRYFFVHLCGIEKRIFVIICKNQKYIFGRILFYEDETKWENLKT